MASGDPGFKVICFLGSIPFRFPLSEVIGASLFSDQQIMYIDENCFPLFIFHIKNNSYET
jgi:hypothetical protein